MEFMLFPASSKPDTCQFKDKAQIIDWRTILQEVARNVWTALQRLEEVWSWGTYT